MAKKSDAPTIKKMPTKAELEKLKQQDDGYAQATADAVGYLNGRKQAIYTIARQYHLDAEELYQEAYEVLLTCVRDYTPVYEREEGHFITVQFNTFFGSRLETRAMELRNRDPEYQARKAMTDGMTEEEREMFRKDPPLLVQHLDQESTLQEALRGEVSEAQSDAQEDVRFKIARDSFFDRKLAELVAREKDEKKQAALMHVKVGGVYNFSEIAYHFGVTDSRASQVMNELMDAFYVQRLIDRSLAAVANDFDKLKFNDKRVMRLLADALNHVDDARAAEMVKIFQKAYPGVVDAAKKRKRVKPEQAAEKEKKKEAADEDETWSLEPPAYEEVFSEKENARYPLLEVGLRPIGNLKLLDLDYRPPESDEEFEAFASRFDVNSPLYPAVISEDGYIIDGERRIRAAKEAGRTDYLCLTRRVGDDQEKKLLRVVVNMRLHGNSKIEMYHAIKALSSLGYSQQKIADYLGTSRTNVLVYCKVRDKALPRLRALFEDGLIQITNASTCVDMPEEVQDQLVNFIRKHGKPWSKGSKFNRLFEAASENRIPQLDAEVSPAGSAGIGGTTAASDTPVGDKVSGRKIEALQKQIEAYSMALKDAEVWASQREGVIKTQRDELAAGKTEVETLKRELEALELMKFGSQKAIEQELEGLRQFYAVTERLAGARHGIATATTQISRIELRRKQVLELLRMMEELEEALNTLRLELHNRGAQLGVTRQKVG